MGLQRLNEKKVRRCAAQIGEEVDAVWTWGDDAWVEGRTPDDRHFTLNRKTGEWEWCTNPTHTTSCPLSKTRTFA